MNRSHATSMFQIDSLNFVSFIVEPKNVFSRMWTNITSEVMCNTHVWKMPETLSFFPRTNQTISQYKHSTFLCLGAWDKMTVEKELRCGFVCAYKCPPLTHNTHTHFSLSHMLQYLILASYSPRPIYSTVQNSVILWIITYYYKMNSFKRLIYYQSRRH